jgi:hypothetical protein
MMSVQGSQSLFFKNKPVLFPVKIFNSREFLTFFNIFFGKIEENVKSGFLCLHVTNVM